jgi:hypothetical protein
MGKKRENWMGLSVDLSCILADVLRKWKLKDPNSSRLLGTRKFQEELSCGHENNWTKVLTKTWDKVYSKLFKKLSPS